MDAVAAVVANICKPSARKLRLEVETPWLGVRRLIVDRHSRLNCKRSGAHYSGGCPDRVRQSAAIDVEVGEEALAQAHVQLGISELEAIVKEHPVAGADGSRTLAKRIPGNADAWCDGAIK